ncbi:recombinase family protein [Moorella sp. E306M]|uniref:recombinase family protein n=1 Tax=Moorella sp. E306M TaxID=2572683 RepID=UPI0010FFB365|nr:recombinase family protein [Moorella sp. E306M]GEA17473.1 integrase [Moorella sp. E306M]
MAKAAIYCRVSSEEQAERGTIEGQVQYAKKYLDLHGPEAGITEWEFYLDEGVSGTVALPDRPAGARLVADARAGKFQVLYVYRLDRLARSVKHVLDTYDLLEKQGIALKSMTEAFDTGTPTGKFFMTLLASIAALERDTILERTQMGKDRKARQGKWVTGMPPFGYRIGADGSLEVYKEEAETVRLIFRLYLDGMSTIDIAKYLNARGIPTPAKSKRTKNKSTGKWHAGHISIILRTEAYTGTYTYLKRSKRRKDTIEIPVPAIVSEKDFVTVQAKLIENADAARGSRGRNYLLRGLIFCGNCGRRMVGSSGMSKEGRVYYRCTGAINTGAGRLCNAKMIRARDIEQAVWQDIEEFAKDPGKVREIMEAKIKENKQELDPVKDELAGLEKAILEKQAARGKVLSFCARGVISDQEAEEELKNLGREIETLVARRDFLFSKQQSAQQFETEALTAQVLMEDLAKRLQDVTDEQRGEIIQALVKRIDVYTIEEDGKRRSKVVIQYRFGPGSEMALYGSKTNRKC